VIVSGRLKVVDKVGGDGVFLSRSPWTVLEDPMSE
jgi:hypothetical protein